MDVDVRTINEHIKKIYSDSELEEASTVRKFRIVQAWRQFLRILDSSRWGRPSGSKRNNHYNLQMNACPSSLCVKYLSVLSGELLIIDNEVAVDDCVDAIYALLRDETVIGEIIESLS